MKTKFSFVGTFCASDKISFVGSFWMSPGSWAALPHPPRHHSLNLSERLFGMIFKFFTLQRFFCKTPQFFHKKWIWFCRNFWWRKKFTRFQLKLSELASKTRFLKSSLPNLFYFCRSGFGKGLWTVSSELTPLGGGGGVQTVSVESVLNPMVWDGLSELTPLGGRGWVQTNHPKPYDFRQFRMNLSELTPLNPGGWVQTNPSFCRNSPPWTQGGARGEFRQKSNFVGSFLAGQCQNVW